MSNVIQFPDRFAERATEVQDDAFSDKAVADLFAIFQQVDALNARISADIKLYEEQGLINERTTRSPNLDNV